MALSRIAQNGIAGVSFPATQLSWFRAGSTAREALQGHQGIEALVCGPMWSSSSAQPVEFLHRKGPEVYPPSAARRSEGATVRVVEGVARMVGPGARDPGGGVAVQGYPVLVQGGAVQSLAHEEQNVGRVALGVIDASTCCFLLGQGLLATFAQGCSRIARDVVYLDGGGSTVLQVPTWPEVSVGSQRYIGGTFLVAMSPGSDIPWKPLAIVGAALGVLWLATRGRRT